MLTAITVVCDNPFVMPVLGAAPRDSLIIQSVTGLGPADKSLFMGDYARDGGMYGGRRVNMRNPVMLVEINPNFGLGESVEGWRDILYRAFNDPNVNSDDVTLILHDDVKPDRFLTGFTEKFETEVFSKDTTAQISMICPDPYLRDVTPTVVTPPAGVEGWQTVPFIYNGSAETGFEVTIKITSATQTLTLDNNGKLMVLTYPTFQVGDIVHVNTKPGERKITLTKASDHLDYDILYTLYSASPWLDLHSQTNSLQVYGDSKSRVVAAITNLTYTQSYWGV